MTRPTVSSLDDLLQFQPDHLSTHDDHQCAYRTVVEAIDAMDQTNYRHAHSLTLGRPTTDYAKAFGYVHRLVNWVVHGKDVMDKLLPQRPSTRP